MSLTVGSADMQHVLGLIRLLARCRCPRSTVGIGGIELPPDSLHDTLEPVQYIGTTPISHHLGSKIISHLSHIFQLLLVRSTHPRWAGILLYYLSCGSPSSPAA
jgi:hypothetical protein